MVSSIARKCVPAWATALAIGVVGLTGCGSIRTAPAPSSTAQLTPNPPIIYVAPFKIQTGKWLVGQDNFFDRKGYNFVRFKQDYQTKFQEMLIQRLMKIAPSERQWGNDLPDEGWLVTGDFLTVYQGSRALRTAIGFGAGEAFLQTRVYVYDLSRSKTEYVLSFYTGVPDAKEGGGAGTGEVPGAVIGNVYGATENFAAGLSLNASRTAREIRDVLMAYR
jgi:hypothetical protein